MLEIYWVMRHKLRVDPHPLLIEQVNLVLVGLRLV